MSYVKNGNGLIRWRFYVKTPAGSEQVPVYGRSWTELRENKKRKEREYECSPERIRLNELLDRYVAYQRQKGADPRNVAMLVQKFEDYVRPLLGNYYLAQLCDRWSIIGQAFEDYEETHPNSRVIQICFDELRRAFKFALSKQWVTVNPVANLKRPSYTASYAIIFSTEQIWKLLELAESQQDRMMLLCLIMTALRPSELWGIKRGAVDLENGVLYVRTFVTTDEHGNKVEKKAGSGLRNAIGKTPRSVREVPLIESLQQAFRFYFRGKDFTTAAYIFPGPKGGLIHDSGWRRNHFKKLVTKLGLPDASPYDLRHSSNSFLADLGVGADIRASICGHSPAVNVNTYTHPRLEAKREALSKLDALLAPGIVGLVTRDSFGKANDEATSGTENAA